MFSLYVYCVYELRMSEDEAQRRCRAARLCRQFPLLLEMLADASIHLTGILLLGPHLNDENHRELLARARYRKKREIEKLVAEIAPRADVPARIEPLHVAPRAAADHATMMASLCGPIRNLPAGNGRGEAPVGALPELELAQEVQRAPEPLCDDGRQSDATLSGSQCAGGGGGLRQTVHAGEGAARWRANRGAVTAPARSRTVSNRSRHDDLGR